ncbi:MAG: polyprenyl synthetase family protein [Clostridia bacterium]|nr:polyprenyl synthetase family protein [Clostridia bacterium]
MIDIKSCQSGPAQDRIDLGQARLLVKERIQSILHRSDRAVRDVMEHLAGSDGKAFRAYLLLAAATDEDGFVPSCAIDAAAALELLHLATLVHDDILDDAPLRRGKASVHSLFGKKTAVLSGDYLFSLALTLIAGIAETHALRYSEFSRSIAQICMGELSQHRHNRDVDLSVFSYLRIISGKTAVLFALAMSAGAILGGYSESQAHRMSRFGFYVGMHFQLADDCLDYEVSTQTMKKQTAKDLAEGVVTLPLIFALAEQPALRELVRRVELTPTEIATISKDLVTAGYVGRARQVAKRYLDKASSILSQVEGQARRQRLGEILTSIAERRY